MSIVARINGLVAKGVAEDSAASFEPNAVFGRIVSELRGNEFARRVALVRRALSEIQSGQDKIALELKTADAEIAKAEKQTVVTYALDGTKIETRTAEGHKAVVDARAKREKIEKGHAKIKARIAKIEAALTETFNKADYASLEKTLDEGRSAQAPEAEVAS